MSTTLVSTPPTVGPIISQNVSLTLIAVVAIFYLVSISFRKNIVDKDGHPIPPGPLLRFAFLRQFPELSLDAWAKKYGPMFSLWMGNQLYIVISDPHVARDIFVNHGATVSSRKNYFIKNQSILRGRAITASPYNDRWRQHRRIATQYLTPKAVEAFTSVIDYEAHVLIRSYFNACGQGTLAIRPTHDSVRFAFNVMLAMSIGTRTMSTNDPLIEQTLAVALEFNDLTGPLSNTPDFIAPLQWISTPLQSRGRKLHNELVGLYGSFLHQVEARISAGENVPDCLAKTLLETREQEGLDWEDMCMLTAVFTLGGVHSTAGIIQWLLALLPSHPEVQRRAHEELDSVIGTDNWPCAEDEHRLPYIRAIIKEVLRFHAPFWMATPHFTTDELVYNGMYIPKNTAVILNVYSLHHDERRYPDSHTFNPDRYLGDDLSSADSSKLSNVMQRDHWTFGAGRRLCPGLVVAERELWLAISRLLWAFTMHEVPGEPISLEEYEGKSGRVPVPFSVRLVPRHDRVRAIVESRGELPL